MIKAWVSMWKNIFNYTGTVTRKDYWLAIVMNIIAMYVGVVPYALILKNFTDNYILVTVVYLIVFHLPVISLYFRRARGASWKVSTAVYLAIVTPVVSGLLVGIVDKCVPAAKSHTITRKVLALCFGLFFYGSIFAAFTGDPATMSIFAYSAIFGGAAALIIFGIVNWRDVVAFLTGRYPE